MKKPARGSSDSKSSPAARDELAAPAQRCGAWCWKVVVVLTTAALVAGHAVALFPWRGLRVEVPPLLSRPPLRGVRGYLCPPIPPVPCREDFADLAQLYLNKTGRAAEVGVHVGEFAAKNLRRWHGSYHMIDAWTYRGGVDLENSTLGDHTSPDVQMHESRMEEARAATAFAGERRELIRGFSHEVARGMRNRSYDWVYIDALHTYRDCKRDLRAWWPKVRCCGVLSGDDYGDGSDTPFLTVERYVARHGLPEITGSGWNWGVIRAVQEFAEEVQSQVLLTYLQDCPPNVLPAWYIIKHCQHGEDAHDSLSPEASR